jgi:biopolymer transport protein TolR
VIFETRHRRFLAEINVIPLVDVVLVLLIIFMVTAPMLYRGMDIKLPTSSSNTIKPEERLVLTVERDQQVYLDKERVLAAQVEGKLRAAKERNPEVSVYLRADKDVPYGTVVQVMDGVKRAGIEKLGMVTDPPGSRTPERIGEQSIGVPPGQRLKDRPVSPTAR